MTGEEIARLSGEVIQDPKNGLELGEFYGPLREAIGRGIIRAVGRAYDLAEEECSRFAAAAVGNTLPGGGRDPAVYEQGIGAERCAALVRGLKQKLEVGATGEVRDGDEV